MHHFGNLALKKGVHQKIDSIIAHYGVTTIDPYLWIVLINQQCATVKY